MQTEDQKRKSEYMREYYSKNRDKINKQRKDRLIKLKEDPEAYKLFRDKRNKNNKKYQNINKDIINKKAKENNWYYDKKKAKVRRDKHYDNHPVKNLLRQRKRYAISNGIPFELDEYWYNNNFDMGCCVTGIPFDKHRSDTPWVAHIDRKIPNKGYTKDNCRLVCACFNLAKKHWSDDDVLKMAKSLILLKEDN